MYEIIKNVIQSKNYELVDMLKKIKTLWLEGDITDNQKGELVKRARENADPANSYAPLQNQIDTLFANYKELAQEILLLKNDGTLPEEPTEEYPAYIQPTGAHDAYNSGDKVTYNGKRYICQIDNCVWAPDIYPDGWELVETE